MIKRLLLFMVTLPRLSCGTISQVARGLEDGPGQSAPVAIGDIPPASSAMSRWAPSRPLADGQWSGVNVIRLNAVEGEAYV